MWNSQRKRGNENNGDGITGTVVGIEKVTLQRGKNSVVRKQVITLWSVTLCKRDGA